jgi:P-type Cu2+ transporter
MNSMAFAAAVYAGQPRGMPEAWVRAFGLAGFAVALPAVAYGAQPFYQGAWRAWRTGRFNVDATVTLGILVAFLASAHAALTGQGGNFSDSLSGLVFFLLAGRWAVRRFEAGLALEGRWFERLAPGHVRVRRGGTAMRVPAAEARAGDLVETGAGEYVPVDGVLETGEAWMDTSLLSGESRAARLLRGDRVFAGYLNLKGRAAVKLTAPGGQTRIAGLRRDLAALAAGRGPVPDGAGAVARRFTLAVAACAAAGFLLHLRQGLPHALETAASVFIVSCACALALATPINRGLGLKRARALGFHFRAQAALEALRGVRCVLFDKTGTLTFTRRAVSGWDWAGPWGSDPARQDSALRALRAATAGSLHPVSLSVQAALEILPPDGLRARSARELPHFGIAARVPGPSGRERAVCLCKYGAWEGPGPFAGLGCAAPEGPLPPADACLFIDGTLAALIRFTEEIKPEAARLMAALQARGLAVALLSGDNAGKVRAFAGACGIGAWRAGLSPEAKRAAAKEYRRRYGSILAVGDGFNDSLLFGSSDLAMAVAGGAADRLEGVDILATGDRPMALASLFALADGVSRGVRRGYWASGLYNAGAIAAALAGWVTPLFAAVLMPISGLSLCLVAWLSIPRQR